MTKALAEEQTSSLVEKDESAEFFAMLPSVFKDCLDCLGVEGLKEEHHDEGMHKPHSSTVL